MVRIRSLLVAMAAVVAMTPLSAVAQTTINLTAVDGYPPKSLWIKGVHRLLHSGSLDAMRAAKQPIERQWDRE